MEELLRPPTFQHPPWTVGLVLVFGAVALLFGILVRPIWLLVGSPFILTLFVWLLVRLTQWRRRRAEYRDPSPDV